MWSNSIPQLATSIPRSLNTQVNNPGKAYHLLLLRNMLHPLQEIRDDLLVHVDSGRGTAGPELGSGCRFAGRGIGRCGIGGGIVGHDRLFFGCRGSVFGVWRWDGGLG